MKRTGRHPIWSWVIHTPWVLATLALLGVIIFFASGVGNPLLKRALVRRIEAATGGKTEVGSLSIRWLALQATIKDLVIHGKEPEGTEPFVAVDQVDLVIRIDSFWSRKVSLDNLTIIKPRLHIRVEPSGASNVPTPGRLSPSTKPVSQTLFDLRARQVKVADGWVLYNDVRAPLSLEGGSLQFALKAGGELERPLYTGNLDWQGIRLAARRYLPAPLTISTKFTLWRDGFALEQGVVTVGRSHFDVQAEIAGWTHSRLNYRYRGWLELLDVQEIFREPQVPTGRVDLHGEGTIASGKASGTGSYSTDNLALYFEDFHAQGLVSRASYRMDEKGAELPDFWAGAMDGYVKGKVTLRFDGMQFRAVTHLGGIRLAEVLPAIEHKGF